jgi:hypothetical protein
MVILSLATLVAARSAPRAEEAGQFDATCGESVSAGHSRSILHNTWLLQGLCLAKTLRNNRFFSSGAPSRVLPADVICPS